MDYIIMCGGDTLYENPPRPLRKVNGEILVARTIRLLYENGVEDIAISSTDERFDGFGVPRLIHENTGSWLKCFYPMQTPVCYLYGDVFYSPQAISTIVSSYTDDIEFFASAPPFSDKYIKTCGEPFAFKVQNTKHFKEAIEKTLFLNQQYCFWRHPISWELWQVIKQTPLNIINYDNYTVINDYTVDIDSDLDAQRIERILANEV